MLNTPSIAGETADQHYFEVNFAEITFSHMQSLVSQSEYREKSTWGLQENLTRYVSELSVNYRSVNVSLYYMEESVLLGTKPLVDSIRHFIRDPSGVFSVCHLCECRIVQ